MLENHADPPAQPMQAVIVQRSDVFTVDRYLTIAVLGHASVS
jgi:hypothetical protein